MVKKLFKHEIFAYGRVLLIAYAVLAAFAIVGRIVQIFETDTIIYNIINGAAVFGFSVGCMFLIGFGTVFGVVRFYRHLFTGEGYLSFTLPVTPTAHLLVKICTAVLFQVLSFAVILLSCTVYTAGDVAVEIGNALAYLYNQAYAVTGMHLPLFIAEAVVLSIVASFAEFATYYLCIAIGQLAHKNRILAAIGVYVGLSIVAQIIATIANVVISVVSLTIDWKPIGEWIVAHPYTFAHSAVGVVFVLLCASTALYLGITHFIIRRKLNLE